MEEQVGFVVVIALGVTSLLIRLALRRSRNADRLNHLHKEMDSVKWTRKGPQLVGQSCAQCKERIIIEFDAKQCSECSAPVHFTCADRHTQSHKDPEGPYR
jgi:hypothetical protein